MKRLLSSFLVGLLVLLPVVLACDLEVGREYEPDGELDDTLAVTETIVGKMREIAKTADTLLRGAHPKSHGCIAAKFEVDRYIDERARVGVFQPGAVYGAWLRFSNGMGKPGPDSKKDVRGVAIKLMGVPGKKLLDEVEDEEKNSQDFFLMSYPQFMVRDASDYVPFTALIAAKFESLSDLVKFAINFLKFSWSTLMQRMNNLRVLWGIVSTGAKITNPLDAQYWSTTPYMLGSAEEYPTNAVKYMMKPCMELPATKAYPNIDNYLRLNMENTLSETDACFDFYVQFQLDACAQPVEDPTVLWDEYDAPYFKVGTISIPKQQFSTYEQDDFCENLTFTPWHSLPEHRPMGGVNRSRREIYLASSHLRHVTNRIAKREPTPNDEIFKRHFQ